MVPDPPPEEQFDIPSMTDVTAFDNFSLIISTDTSPPSTDSGSSQADSPPDWSQFSNLWDNDTLTLQPSNLKFDPSSFDFNNLSSIPLNMDLDFNLSLAVDPTALHFDSEMFTTTELSPSHFPSQRQVVFPPGLAPRRMSITSLSSSSGASLSPILDPASASSVTSVQSTAATPSHLTPGSHFSIHTSLNDPVDELAQSVRQTAGVTLAVPVQGQAEQFTFPNVQKLPIPRLHRPSPHVTSIGSKRKSPSLEPIPSSDAALGGTAAVIGRPKTSHTTIERRYRTNLNARIQSLKDAVPALRVLENKEKVKKSPDADLEEKGEKLVWNDVVDERGFVDGVKAARKISKANVLGKAAEYIHVLKRRENRLKREQAGLRSLISGLVGGPALLREWEREWVSRFDISDDDGADDGESDDGEDDSPPKKRIKGVPKKEKVTKDPKSKKEEQTSGIVPEKRKRGRPRKVQPAPEGEATKQRQQTQDIATSSPAQPTQYLLAVFTFFSFFNSPFTSHSRPLPTHSGVVLADSGALVTPAASTSPFSWSELLQVFHLVVSGLVLCSLLLPFLPKDLPRFRTLFLSSDFPRTDAARRFALIKVLDPAQLGTPNEAALLRTALGVYPGFLGLLMSLVIPKRGGKTKSLEHKQLEQRAWVRLAELAVFDRTTSLGLRAQAYWGMVSHTPTFATSPSDLSTLALLVFPVWRARAVALWTRAIHARVVRPFERAVIGAMTVEEASTSLTKTYNVRLTPLGSLAMGNVRKGVSHLAGRAFVRAVLGADSLSPDSEVYDGEKDSCEDEERRAVVDAGRSMGGRSAELVGLLERVCTGGFVRYEETKLPNYTDVDEEERSVRVLLDAIVLYRRLFPSTLHGSFGAPVVLSPPPSPSRRNAGLRAALRVALDEEVFYDGGSELEEARDRVIDMLVEMDRASRRRV
ncbi:hypothetical protein B0F90DRAFT_1701784 [Multifurca ochricompacta]|uniref:BHLH domain-containing protein n=1 Tax=Multifurca ochricompacta TaxID=376703 RepID=A0AAD4QP15_9AGAM|nr:hypothetical protein B0F90DRAFT_1701784 [Multifurca ochricompacta]